MALVENSRERIGEKRLGVLFDGGKVRRRREWRGIKAVSYTHLDVYKRQRRRRGTHLAPLLGELALRQP